MSQILAISISDAGREMREHKNGDTEHIGT
jgi:hypothetical protein